MSSLLHRSFWKSAERRHARKTTRWRNYQGPSILSKVLKDPATTKSMHGAISPFKRGVNNGVLIFVFDVVDPSVCSAYPQWRIGPESGG